MCQHGLPRVARSHMKLSLPLAGLLASCTPICCPKAAAARQSPPLRRVVLVHGFLDTGDEFHRLRQRLENRGIECLVPKLSPSDGRGGLEHLAAGLKRDIDAAYGPEQPVSIIAFSMGGLVSRFYLQNLDGTRRCEKLITISSPHHGTLTAWLYPSKGAAQMRPGSRFLSDLDQSTSRLGRMPVISYRTRMDLMILPSGSSVWDRAVNVEHPALLHPLMLYSPHVLEDVTRRLLDEEPLIR